MNLKIYRVVHLLVTAMLAFLISIPILERGGIDRDVIDDSFFIVVWLVGGVLLFNKKFVKYSLALSTLLALFFILSKFI